MTKISNQYSLTNILTADLANSRLGINNVSPAYSLDLTGTARTSGATYLAITSGIVNVNRTLALTAGTYQSQKLVVTGGIGINSDPADGVSRLSLIGDSSSGDGIIDWGGNGAFNLRFSNNGSERMRITSTGNVGIGSTTAGAQLTLAQNNANSSAQTYLTFRNLATNYGSWAIWKTDDNNLGFYYGVNSDTPSAGINMKLRYNGVTEFYSQVCIGTTTTGVQNTPLCLVNSTQTARIWSTGPNTSGDYVVYSNSGGGISGVYVGYGATSWTSNSDERLKNITGNINNALNDLMTLRTIKHTWKLSDNNKEYLALIAQDVQKVFPQVVDIQDNEIKTLGVRYTELIPVLVKAIQELSAKVSLLENK